jgi:transcriptional regulator with XRE-family HTH domain
MEAKGYTLKELAKALGISEHSVHMRISRAGIKPITREAIYPPDTLDRIREAPMGRPPKKPEEPGKAKKGNK